MSDSEDDFVKDQNELYEKNKQREKSRSNQRHLDPSDKIKRTPSYSRFSEELPAEAGKRTWYKLELGETFIQGLQKMDPSLVSKAKNDLGVFGVHTVHEGEIGKALHNGTFFYFFFTICRRGPLLFR